MTTSVLDDAPAPAYIPEVDAFAAAVRTALDDLAAEERDDLTDGLEAELLDRVADSGIDSLGDPDAYAADLRAAAGLPPRTVMRTSLRRSAGEFRRLVADRGSAFLARHPLWRGLAGFLVSLRPAWWVLRAVVAYQVGAFVLAGMGGNGGFYLLPIDGGKLLVLAILIVLSVQFGRGRWLPLKGMRVLAITANVILAITAPFVVAQAAGIVNQHYWASISYDDHMVHASYGWTAQSVDGNPVTNVFAYDAEGNPLTDVRLFDQDGRPLYVGGSDGGYTWDPMADGRLLVPNSADPGDGWNVYPLATISERDIEYGPYGERISPDAARLIPGFPFAVIPPLVGVDGGDADATDGAETGPAAEGGDAPAGEASEVPAD